MRPTTFGSPPKRSCQRRWLRTATRRAFGRSSSSEIVRPSSGPTPRSGKNSADTICAASRVGSPDCRQRHRGRAPRGEPLERAALCLPVHPVRGRHRLVVACRSHLLPGLDVEGLVDGDQPVARRIRQRPQQQLVDDREDRGVAADPEREGEDDGDREAGTLSQPARHVTRRRAPDPRPWASYGRRGRVL